MKIARIETFVLSPGAGKNLLFCRVETESGLHGWGEAYVPRGRDQVVDSCLRTMAPHMIGRSAFNIRHTAQIIHDDFATRRGSLELLSAWSAIEIALWDILGKHTGLPVYNLLGGASRERVRVYANGWSESSAPLEENLERALALKEQGFTAAKWDPFPGPRRNSIERADEDIAINYVRRMREVLGPDFELLIEAHRRFSPPHAIRIGKRLVEFGIDWYEEPCPCEDIEQIAEVRRAVPIPIVTGEAMYSKESFFQALAIRAADVFNPDVCAMGGITALMDVAAMAQARSVEMAPHNFNSTLVGLAASMHVCAVIPNFRITEYFVNMREGCDAVALQSLNMQGGWVDLPTTPGLGVDLDAEALRARPYQAMPNRRMRHYWEEFPRKDYVPGSAH